MKTCGPSIAHVKKGNLVGLLYALTAVIIGAVLPENNATTALYSTGIT